MGENVYEIDRLSKYVAEINELKTIRENLEKQNRELEARLAEMLAEYMKLRDDMEGMASQGEVLVLRQQILELQNELRLKRNVPQEVPTDQGLSLVQGGSRSVEDVD